MRKKDLKAYHLFIYLLFLTILISLKSFGQVVFEKGYFIDNENEKTECLIKNFEWKNSPTQIEYKLAKDSESTIATIDDIKEFGVSNYKYIRFTVNIDQSGESISDLSEDKEPILVEETMFLRAIVEGSASLYLAAKQKRYFFSINSSEAVQLIYKEYISNTRVLTNNTYKSQLWEGLSCDCITLQDIEKTNCNKVDLIKIFEKYNNCVEADFINYNKNNKRVAFNLSIRPGLKAATLSIENYYNDLLDIDFGSSLSFSFGIAAELVLPFNKNKWAVTFEPTYQYYKAEDPRPNISVDVDYKSIELPIGVKYNFFLSEKSKIFVTAAVVVLDIPFNSSIGSLEVITTNNFNFGFGYCFNNKYSAEIRYGSRRRLLANYALYSSNYQSLSFILGYNIF